MKTPRIQDGFTIIELMVAMTVGMMLMVVLGGIYFDSVRQAESITQKLTMNREAREIFDIISMGGRRDSINSHASDTNIPDKHDYIFGLRGRKYYPGASHPPGDYPSWGVPDSILAINSSLPSKTLFRVGLPRNTDVPEVDTSDPLKSNSPITSSEYQSGNDGISATCTDVDFPFSGCENAGDVIVIRGYVRMDVKYNDTALKDDLSSSLNLPILLVNPTIYDLAYNRSLPGTSKDDAFDIYWTAIHPMVGDVPTW